MATFTVETWDGDVRVHGDIEGLSVDAARELARAHAACGYTVRVKSEQSDYCEVTSQTHGTRIGTFAQTTLVR